MAPADPTLLFFKPYIHSPSYTPLNSLLKVDMMAPLTHKRTEQRSDFFISTGVQAFCSVFIAVVMSYIEPETLTGMKGLVNVHFFSVHGDQTRKCWERTHFSDDAKCNPHCTRLLYNKSGHTVS